MQTFIPVLRSMTSSKVISMTDNVIVITDAIGSHDYDDDVPSACSV
jgi:hypothetical protein